MSAKREWAVTRESELMIDADLLESGIDGVWRDAYVRSDGCVEYRRYYNSQKGAEGRNGDDTDGIHLCSIAETVGELIDLLRLAQRTLGGEWNGEARDLDNALAERGYITAPRAVPTGEEK